MNSCVRSLICGVFLVAVCAALPAIDEDQLESMADPIIAVFNQNQEQDGTTVEADVQEDAAASMRPPPAPTPAKEDVSRVWTDMKSWGTVRPSPPGGADIKMYMQDNHMTMDATRFVMNGGSDAQMDDFFGSTPTSNSQVKEMSVKAGAVGLGRFTLRDSMTMTDTTQITNGQSTHDDKTVVGTEKEEQVELIQQSSTQQSEVHSAEQSTRNARNVYMSNNEMSMETTVFTMNVGTGSEATEDLQASTNMASVDTLNINMYMHENDMLMDGTKFEMNVAIGMLDKAEAEELVQVQSVASKGIRGADLTRLALLQVPWVLGAEGASLAEDGNPAGDDQSVWDWLKGWTTSTASQRGAVDINMFMYNNSMSMNGIDFAFNVGTAATELVATSDTVDHAAQNKATHAAAAAEKAAPPPKYMYQKVASMKGTTFTMGVGDVQETVQESAATQESVNLYMANNKMSMTNTVFKMNVGSGSTELANVQGGISEDARTKTKMGQTLNCKSLNVRMYMYKNSMAMKTTEFTWNVESSEQNSIETREATSSKSAAIKRVGILPVRKPVRRRRRPIGRPIAKPIAKPVPSRSSLPPHWGVRRITKPPKATKPVCARWCYRSKKAKWTKKCYWKHCAGCAVCKAFGAPVHIG